MYAYELVEEEELTVSVAPLVAAVIELPLKISCNAVLEPFEENIYIAIRAVVELLRYIIPLEVLEKLIESEVLELTVAFFHNLPPSAFNALLASVAPVPPFVIGIIGNPHSVA